MNNIEGTSARKIKIDPTHEEMLKEDFEDKLKDYSSISNFNDDTWVINKINQDKNLRTNQRSLYFSRILPVECRVEVKQWAILQLIQRKSVQTITDKIGNIAKLTKHMDKNIKSFKDTPKEALIAFHKYLFEDTNLKKRVEIWQAVASFFKELNYYELYQEMNKFVIDSPPEKTPKEKYIPEEIAEKLDVVMKKEEIPLSFKTIYWLLRLIPNRITEVLSMTINCLKQINENTYIISIPTFKQAGQYHKGSVKLIEIKYEGIGKYLIDLISEQINFVKSKNITEDNFLFHSHEYRLYKKKNNTYKYSLCNKEKINIISIPTTELFIKNLCEVNNIVKENGDTINITSHMFRHNAITDRLTSGIFRAIDIMPLTAHHNTAMIEKSYTHFKPEDLKIESSPIMFRGKIINTDNTRQIDMILKRPYAYSIHGLGICSDVSGCDKNKSECYRCPYMIPDFNQLDRYKMEMEKWKSKKEKSDKIGNVAFSELCEYWIESYEILIQRILKAISNEDLDIE